MFRHAYRPGNPGRSVSKAAVKRAGLQVVDAKPLPLAPFRAEQGVRDEIEANFVPGSRRPVPVVVTARNWQMGASAMNV
jgi:hypothetical protein